MTTPPSLILRCEVAGTRRAEARNLAAIAVTCARDLNVRLELEQRRHAAGDNAITLHLPVEFAIEQHPAWCLACRLACFCPEARVSVLIEGGNHLFQPAAAACKSA